MKIDQNRARGSLIGMACGDAIGTSVEFRPRGSFPPVTDMCGGGPFRLNPGEWTDDTSMALCIAESLIEKGEFDPDDQMARYLKWAEDGHLSSTGECFDIGVTVSKALESFKISHNPYSGPQDPETAGNGCIMRLAPIPIFYFPDTAAVIQFSAQSSRTTHGARECIDAAKLFGVMLYEALAGKTKEQILFESVNILQSDPLMPRISEIANGKYRDKSVDQIRGSGYVVESLEAALWCFYKTEDFKEAILLAANLGEDADTTAAVCGQIAGAFYGEQEIPIEWRERLAKFQLISDFADKLIKG